MKYNLLKSLVILSSITSSWLYAADKHYSLPLSKPGEPVSVEVQIHRGNVVIQGYKGDTIEITANNIQPKGVIDTGKKSKLAKKIRKKLNSVTPPRSVEGLKPVKNSMMRLEIEEQGNEVEISSEQVNQYVNLLIKIPMRSKVSVELYQGGDINIDGIGGSLELEAYEGGINATNIWGPIVAETYQKDIVVEFNGLAEKTPSSLTSQVGNIDITLAKEIKSNVNVQTYQGEIFSGLKANFVANDKVKKKKKGKKQEVVIGGMMQAKVNGGGQELSLITYTGNLYIRKAK